jgi:hypothetical protein
VADTDPGGIVWKEGTWSGCLETLQALVSTSTPMNVQSAIVDTFPAPVLQIGVNHERRRRVSALAASLYRDPGGESAQREAARMQLVADRVGLMGQLAPALALALSDPVLADSPDTRAQLAAMRTITVEDVEQIFDYTEMATCAHALAAFLFGRAFEEERFDDYRQAMRLTSLYIDGRIGDIDGTVSLSLLVLACMLSIPVVGPEDAAERVEQARRLLGLLAPLRTPGQDSEVLELLDAAEGLTVESFHMEGSASDYDAVLDRLESAFEATSNQVYVDDLIVYCTAPRPEESPRQRARRLADLAVFTNMRGSSLHRRSDLVAALEHQRAALESSDPDDPNWNHYRKNAAAYEVNLLRRDDKPVGSALDRLLELLPPLPYEPRLGAGRDLGGAYTMRASVELEAGREEQVDPEARIRLLSNAVAAAEVAQRLLAPASFQGKEARAFAIAAQAACLAHRQDPPSAADLQELSALVADPRSATEAYDTALGVAAELALKSRVAFEVFRPAVARASAIVSAQPSERLAQSFFICRMAVVLALHDRDVEKSAEARETTVGLVAELSRAAMFMARGNPERSSTSTPLAQAAALAREVALQLVEIGALDGAAVLAEVSSAMGATDAVAGPGTPDALALFREHQRRTDECSSLIVLVGGASVAVLARAPGSDWQLVSFDSSAALDHFAAVDWSSSDEMTSVFALKAELTELSRVLGRMLGDTLVALQATATSPVLCLPTGTSVTYPLGLVHWARPDVRMPLVVAPGPLTDGIAAHVTEPLPDEPRIVVLAGASTADGTGVIDSRRDVAAIESAGLAPIVVDSAADGRLQALDDAEIVHYAGHLLPAGPDETMLTFGDGTAVPLGSIRGMSLRQVRVATLIACYSGFDSSDAAEQVEHAAGAFLEAGVATVIAALWPVFDKPAELFTQRFYQAVAAGSSTAEGFSAAVEAVRGHRIGDLTPYEHPVYWGSFTLFAGTGSWWPARAVDVSEAPRS